MKAITPYIIIIGMIALCGWGIYSLGANYMENYERLHRPPVPQCTQAEADMLHTDVFHCLPAWVQKKAWTAQHQETCDCINPVTGNPFEMRGNTAVVILKCACIDKAPHDLTINVTREWGDKDHSNTRGCIVFLDVETGVESSPDHNGTASCYRDKAGGIYKNYRGQK